MATSSEAVQFSNIAAGNTAAFTLRGGRYSLLAKSTGAGTIDLKVLLPDGATWQAVATQITATSGYQGGIDLPPGQYRFEIATFTANFLTICRIPS